MNNMTWLELYNFLHDQANNPRNIGSLDWNEPIKIYDATTGDEKSCDTYYVNDKLVLITNIEYLYSENE